MKLPDACTVTQEKKLPKLHRAVWKCDLKRVKKLLHNITEKELNAQDAKFLMTAIHIAYDAEAIKTKHLLLVCHLLLLKQTKLANHLLLLK